MEHHGHRFNCFRDGGDVCINVAVRVLSKFDEARREYPKPFEQVRMVSERHRDHETCLLLVYARIGMNTGEWEWEK